MTAMLTLDADGRSALFDLLVAMLWADDEVADAELARAHGARMALGLFFASDDDEPTDRIVMRGPIGIFPTLARRSARDRVIAYAAASWMALADHKIDPAEQRMLSALSETLRLSPEHRALATGAARLAHAADAPPHRAFGGLLRTVADRFATLEAHLAAA